MGVRTDEPPLDVEVLAHADLLAVEEDRRAGQREHQRVDEADAALVAAEHRAAAGVAGRGRRAACRARGRRRRRPRAAPSSVSLSRVSSSWLRTKLAHWLVMSSAGRSRSASASGRGVAAGEGEVEPLHADEVELHVEPVAVGAAEEALLLRVGQVDLAEQHGVADPAGDEGAHVAEVAVGVERLGVVDAGHRVAGEEEGHGIDPEARDAELQPEAERLGNLFLHSRIRDVEVGLGLVEVVQEPLARALVELPDAVLLVGEDDVLGARPRLRSRPTRSSRGSGSSRAAAGGLEPRVLVARVVHDEVDDDAQAGGPGGAHQLDEVAVAAEPRVDAEEVGDVVAVVLVGGRVERHEPQARHAEVGEVLDALGHAAQVALPSPSESAKVCTSAQ